MTYNRDMLHTPQRQSCDLRVPQKGNPAIFLYPKRAILRSSCTPKGQSCDLLVPQKVRFIRITRRLPALRLGASTFAPFRRIPLTTWNDRTEERRVGKR